MSLKYWQYNTCLNFRFHILGLQSKKKSGYPWKKQRAYFKALIFCAGKARLNFAAIHWPRSTKFFLSISLRFCHGVEKWKAISKNHSRRKRERIHNLANLLARYVLRSLRQFFCAFWVDIESLGLLMESGV